MTSEWYRKVLEKLPEGSLILDVGIGTGSALIRNKDLILKKKLRVVGVDYDKDYVRKCANLITSENLSEQISVQCISIYDFQTSEQFDAIYFSGSLMIMPDPVAALVHVSKMLKRDGKIYCTQTFEEKKNILLEKVKPLLKFLTTIDFGNVTYEKDFIQTFAKAALKIEQNIPISGNAFNSSRTFKLIIASLKTRT